MPPTLHHGYTPADAVAAFAADARPAVFCDGQFAVLPEHVLGFVTVGDAATASHVPGPSCVIWRPARLDYHPTESCPWLPEAVSEVYDRTRTHVHKIREHHLLLRAPTDDRVWYAGPAHLGCLTGPPDATTVSVADRSACFTLDTRLPRDLWLHLGGYPGWLVEVNHQTQRVDARDLDAFRRLTAELPRQEFAHLSMTRYEGDALTVHTNARRGWLMFQRSPTDGGLYTEDPDYAGDPAAEEFFLCACGIDLQFPAARTLPRDRAIRAAEEFFATGALPRGLVWSDGGTEY